MIRRWSIIVSFILILALYSAAMACPMCKDSLANGDSTGAGKLPNGFNTSIILMLTGFLSVVGLVAGIIWKGIRGTL